jgi:hypothetical protein
VGFRDTADLESPRSIHYAHDMWRTCSALVRFAWVAGAIWASAGTASAAPASHSRHGTAPGDVLTLSNYVMQPPGDEGDGDVVRDSTGTRPKVLEPPVHSTGADTVPTQPIKPPAWAFPDSARNDTAAVTTTSPTSQAALPAGPHPSPKTRRGVLGIHPIALLVGMIALHVFVVGLATK